MNISTTIKRKWMDKILTGEKTSEFKNASDFWNKRLFKYIGTDIVKNGSTITFLCGRKVYRYIIKNVLYYPCNTPPKEIDGKLCSIYWEIQLGERLSQTTPPLKTAHDDGR